MQTPPLLTLLRWSARTKLYQSISTRPLGVEQLFLKLGFTPCKAEQPLRGMELQEREAQEG